MKIPFDIKYRPQIESGEYTLETAHGCSARIICWDKIDNCPIVALWRDTNGYETCDEYDEFGRHCYGISERDLYLVDYLTEFEEELLKALDDADNNNFANDPFKFNVVKIVSAKLLLIAKKDLPI